MLQYVLFLKRRHSLFSINIYQRARFFNSLVFLSSILVKKLCILGEVHLENITILFRFGFPIFLFCMCIWFKQTTCMCHCTEQESWRSYLLCFNFRISKACCHYCKQEALNGVNLAQLVYRYIDCSYIYFTNPVKLITFSHHLLCN